MKNRGCLAILISIILLTACSQFLQQAGVGISTSGTDSSNIFTPIDLRIGYGMQSSQCEIYFTDPTSPYAYSIEGGVDELLAEAINTSRISLDVAIYNLNLWSIRDALLRAQRRGVTIRVVTDSDNLDRNEIQDLIAAGIPVVGDRRESLMHHKFAIIDRREIWTGSMNFTVSSAYYDNNNLIRIRSDMIAETYLQEFEEMFIDDLFGDMSRADTLHPRLTIAGNEVEVYFSPDDGVSARLVDLLNYAEDSIHFLAFSFTSDDLGAAIRTKSREGVVVAGIMDDDQILTNQGTEFDPFRAARLDVYKDQNRGSMHHKVIIIDSEIVITGSYNFSRSAEERNDENVLIFHSPAIAEQYLFEFQRLYDQVLLSP
jgi:phosphatidylserine/phosphatidylglycerophosphate/cardiolipin synthase-like enzyme